MSKKVKVFAIVVLIIAAGIAVMTYLGNTTSSTKPAQTNQLTSSATRAAGVVLPSTAAPASEFAALLSTIKSISIDTSIFTNSAYRTLRDYPITLGTDIEGRPNPFAAVGYDFGAISGTAPVQVQFETIQPSKITKTTAEFAAQGILSTTDQASVVFEYGTNDLLSSATGPVTLSKNGTAIFRVSGLLPKTTYFVRAVLAQGSITKQGDIMTFTTL